MDLLDFQIRLKDLLSPGLQRANDLAKKFERKIDDVDKKSSHLGNTFSKLGGLASAAFAAIGISKLGGDVIKITSDFQKYQAVLTNMLGSSTAAAGAFDLIQKVAKKTPDSVNDITEAFVKLSGRGIIPTEKQLLGMSDLAATLGKPLSQLNEAILDVNNTERWTELGIKVKTEGNKIVGTYRGMTVEAERTEKGAMKMVDAFTKIKGVGGTSESVAKTLGGQLNILGDTYDALTLKIGKSSNTLITGGISFLSKILDFASEMVDNLAPVQGALSQLFDALSPIKEAIGNLAIAFGLWNGESITAAGVMNTVANVIKTVADVIQPVISLIVSLTGFIRQHSFAFKVLGTILAGIMIAMKTYSLIMGIAALATSGLVTVLEGLFFLLTANPVGLAIAAIAGLIAIIVLAWNNCETFRNVVQGLWETTTQVFKNMYDSAKTYLGGVIELIQGIINLDANKIKNGITQIGKGLVGGLNPLAGTKEAFKKGYNQEELAKKATEPAQKLALKHKREQEILKDFDKEMEMKKNANALNSVRDKAAKASATADSGKSKKAISDISSSKPSTININIDSIVKEQNLSITNVSGAGLDELKRRITEVFQTASQDVAIIANGIG